MNKKIIAIALILVLMVTVFTACKDKYIVQKINGIEYPVVVDKEGNTVIDEEYRVAVYVTDEDGDVYKDNNGETHTNWVQVQGSIKTDKGIKGENFELLCIPGWHTGDLDRIIKDETSDNCYIQFTKVSDIDEDLSLKSYLEELDAQSKTIVDALTENGYTCTINTEEKEITSKHISCIAYQYKVVDKDNKVVHYAENYIFSTEETIYSVNYACVNGVGYDESFNFESYLDVHFAFND